MLPHPAHFIIAFIFFFSRKFGLEFFFNFVLKGVGAEAIHARVLCRCITQDRELLEMVRRVVVVVVADGCDVVPLDKQIRCAIGW